jgi:hypothetical protein
MAPKRPPGDPMTRGNMRHLGVQRLIAYCLNPSCRHEGLIDVSSYPADAEVPSFARKLVCAKCGARGRHIDVRPNWKEQPQSESLTGKQWRVDRSACRNALPIVRDGERNE